MTSKKLNEQIAFVILRVPAALIVIVLVLILGYLISNGAGVISWDFFTKFPEKGMTAGGIFPAIIGTIYLMCLTAVIAIPLGVFAAVYLSEYARGRKASGIVRVITVATNVLAGVPSIVYGLFGLGFFVMFLNMGFSLTASAFTLSFLTLPVIIAASEEALKSVPLSYREAALALGATKWQMVKLTVIPPALPGILTSIILGLSRAAGETAPILLTGVAYYMARLPTSISDQFMALPFHIFTLSTQSVNPQLTRPLQFGSVLTLLLIVLSMNSVAIYIRLQYRRKMRVGRG